MQIIIDTIQQEVNEIISSATFQAWKAKENVTPNDKVVLNNSFIYREVLTKKSLKYLAIDFDVTSRLKDIWVLDGIEKNDNDFKKFSPQLIASKGFILNSISNEVNQEFLKLGKLLFILIGKIDDRLVFEEDLHGVNSLKK